MAGLFHGPGSDVELQSQLLAVPVHIEVHIYALDPARLLTSLRHHSAAVVSACFAASDLLTASADGCIAHWDIQTWTIKSSISVDGSIFGLVAPSGCDLAHVAMRPHQSGKRIRFVKRADGMPLHIGLKLSSLNPLVVSGDGSAVATWDGRRALVWSACQTEGTAVRPLVLHHTKDVTCIALSSSADTIAVGDVSGRITIWSNCVAGLAAAVASEDSSEGDSDVVPAPHVVHWHSGAVLALAFSLDMLRLLSGGHEAVLVTWELRSNAKSFIAGMSHSITRILPAKQHSSSYVTLHADNSLWQVDTSTGHFSDIDVGLLPKLSHTALLAPLNRPGHPGQVVVASALGRVQLYDAPLRHNVAQLQMPPSTSSVGRNFRAPSAIRHMAVSGDGLTIVVVEQSSALPHSPALEHAERLDTWVYNTTTCCFQLLMRADAPISSPISSMVHHPWEAQLVIGSASGTVTLCTPSTTDLSWAQSRVLCPAGSRVGCLAFSGDGSVLAAGAAEQVMLYDMASGALCTALPHTPTIAAQPPLQLSFSPCGLLIVVDPCNAAELRLTAWNLLTSRVQWSTTTPAQSCALSATNNCIAVAGPCHSDAVESSEGGAATSAVSDSAQETTRSRRNTRMFDGLLQLNAATGQPVDSWMAAPHSLQGLLYKNARPEPEPAQAKPQLISFSHGATCYDWGSDEFSATSVPNTDATPSEDPSGAKAFMRAQQPQAHRQPSTALTDVKTDVTLPGHGRQSHAIESVVDSARTYLLDLVRSDST